MLTLQHPLYLLAMAPLGLLPLLMRRTKAPSKQLHFAAMTLAVALERPQTTRGRRPPRLPLLFVRMVLLLLLIVALARPEPARLPSAPDRLEQALIVLDTSPSMAYTLDGQSLFERARQAIFTELERGRYAGGVGLICTSVRCPYALPLGSSEKELTERLKSARPLPLAEDLAHTLWRAQRVASERGMASKTVVFVASDLRASSLPDGAVMPELANIRFAELMSPGQMRTRWPNVGVLGASLCSGGGKEGARIAAEFFNWGAEAQNRTPLRILVDNEVVLRDEVDLVSGQKSEHTVDVPLDASRAHELSIELGAEGDGFREDDSAQMLVPAQKPLRIVAINGEPSENKDDDELNFFAEALRQHPAQTRPLRLFQLGRKELLRALAQDTKMTPDVLVLANIANLSDEELRRIVELNQAGMGLLVTSGAQMQLEEGASTFEKLLDAELRAIDAVDVPGEEAPDTAPRQASPHTLRLGGAIWAADDVGPEVQRALLQTHTRRRLAVAAKPGSFERALEFGDGAPALWVAERGRGRRAILTTSLDLAWSDLAISSAFVPLTQTLVRWLARAEERAFEPLVRGASLVVPRAALDATQLVGPSGTELIGQAEGAQWRLGPLEEVGLYRGFVRLSADEPLGRAPYLDTVVRPDLTESDFAPSKALEALAGQAAPKAQGAEPPSGPHVSSRYAYLVPLMAVAAVMLLVLEAYLCCPPNRARPYAS